jgi:hypothetical protein
VNLWPGSAVNFSKKLLSVTIKNLAKAVLKALPVVALLPPAFAISGCNSIDDERTPLVGVWIVFTTQDMWTTYGVPGALDHRRFILSEGIPQNFPYSVAMQTGYGGVLLVGDINGNPAAYDLSCPVENKTTVRIHVDNETNDAVCSTCGSHYSIYNNYGLPTEGPAAKQGYALRKYAISAGSNGEYRVIHP